MPRQIENSTVLIADQSSGRPSLAPPRAPGFGSHSGTESDSHYDTADDEILDAVLRSAGPDRRASGAAPRNRRRARNADRKSREWDSMEDLFRASILKNY